MQFRDLKKQYEALEDKINHAIMKVISECNFISGAQVHELEEELAEYVGAKHCITCANGTDALSLALMVWNIGKGDAVFVPDFTFFASGEVVAFHGATPIFVDVNPDTFNMSVESLEDAIRTVIEDGRLVPRVIIPVDLFGQPADYENIRKIANKYNLLILEDGAQGFGGRIGKSKACNFGDISTTSFFPAKPLGCYGDGGAIFTNDDTLAKELKSLCVHGKGADKYDNIKIGLNSRLDTIQAAILKVKLQAFKEYELENVNMVADKYSDILGKLVKTPMVLDGYYSSWAQYTIQLRDMDERDSLQQYLKERMIPSMIYYQKPMHRQKAFAEYDTFFFTDLSTTERLCKCVLSIPIHPYMGNDDIEQVASVIAEFRKNN